LLRSDRPYSKEEVIERLSKIRDQGWIPSHRKRTNAGAVGNTLEDLLGIKENNLPIANAGAWELKAQRKETESLTTLFHSEPYPREEIVEHTLLPKYGWPHATKANENSFRQTISTLNPSDRGFKVIVDNGRKLVAIDFDSAKVQMNHVNWLESVKARVGNLGKLSPEPHWSFEILQQITTKKLTNSFYLEAESKKANGPEEFRYSNCVMLEHFDFNRFIRAIQNGFVLVDFDASTSHNHGTKFRMKRDSWNEFYGNVEQVF